MVDPAVQVLKGLKILLVEDSADNQLLVKRLLSRQGADVEVADNGKVGVQKALDSEYDLVLMDIQMPIMDGYTATRELRAKGYTRPIVALTAHAISEERQRCLSAGCDSHLVKPIDSKLLIETVAEFARAQ